MRALRLARGCKIYSGRHLKPASRTEHVSFKYNTRELLLNTLGRYLLGPARNGAFLKCPLIRFLDEAHQFIGRSMGDDTDRVSLDAFGLIAKKVANTVLRPRDVPPDVLRRMIVIGKQSNVPAETWIAMQLSGRRVFNSGRQMFETHQ